MVEHSGCAALVALMMPLVQGKKFFKISDIFVVELRNLFSRRIKKMHRNDVPQISFRPKSLIEERLQISQYGNAAFDIILSLINDEPEENAHRCRYSVNLGDYARYVGVKYVKDLYPKLRRGFDEIFNKSVAYGNSERGGEFHIIAERTWDDRNMEITFTLSPTTKAMLLMEKEKRINAYYAWRYPLSLSSKYSGLLYYMFKEWEWQSANQQKGVHKESVKQLRYMLAVPESYKTSNVMKLLDECVEDISRKTDINVSYKVNTIRGNGGEKVDSVTFMIRANDEIFDEEVCRIKMLIDKELKYYGFDLDDRTRIEMAENAKINRISDNTIRDRIHTAYEKKDSIRSLPGYMRFLMNDRYEDAEKESSPVNNFMTRDYSKDFDLEQLIDNR